eukprot:359021-Chlamydomonas_euryale.AAC.5
MTSARHTHNHLSALPKPTPLRPLLLLPPLLPLPAPSPSPSVPSPYCPPLLPLPSPPLTALSPSPPIPASPHTRMRSAADAANQRLGARNLSCLCQGNEPSVFRADGAPGEARLWKCGETQSVCRCGGDRGAR